MASSVPPMSQENWGNQESLDLAYWLRSITRIKEWNGTFPFSWSQGSPECLCRGPCRYIRIGDKECEFNKNFRLILHTKLANPHYKPELQAQTTLLNFTVTEDGLEGQLLAEVVSVERPDLERLKVNITASTPELTRHPLSTDDNARCLPVKQDSATEESPPEKCQVAKAGHQLWRGTRAQAWSLSVRFSCHFLDV